MSQEPSEMWSRLRAIQEEYYPESSLILPESESSQSDEFSPKTNKPPLDHVNFFKDHVFFILLGGKVSTKLLQIFKNGITHYGGEYEGIFSPKVTDVIVGCEYDRIPKEITSISNKIRLLEPSWLSKCLQEKQLISTTFHMKRKPLTQSVSSENPTKSVKTENSTNSVNKSAREYLACQIQYKDDFNHNKPLVKALKELEEIYNTIGEKWRSYAIHKAIEVIKKIPKIITSLDDVKEKIHGEKTLEKIEQFLNFGRIERLEGLSQTDQFKIIKNFLMIHGIGQSQANKWYAEGLKSFDDLKKIQLTHQQSVSLKYLKDTQQRIPRAEIEKVEILLKKICDKAFPNVTLTICGSYRRGATSCGDIDVLVCDSDESPDTLYKLVTNLVDIGFLIDYLTETRETSDMYMGICKIDTLHRRIDIKLYAPSQYAFAVLQFTGSAYFNRSMKYHAKKLGYRLGDKAIRTAIRVGKEVVSEGPEIPCETERDIFNLLGLEYREPDERNV
jgi:DNA polymerase/3'-5' exonuclease PolX